MRNRYCQRLSRMAFFLRTFRQYCQKVRRTKENSFNFVCFGPWAMLPEVHFIQIKWRFDTIIKGAESGCDHVVRTAPPPVADGRSRHKRPLSLRSRTGTATRAQTERRANGLFSGKNGAFQTRFCPDRLVLIPTKRSAEQRSAFADLGLLTNAPLRENHP